MGVTVKSVYQGDYQVTSEHQPSGAKITTDLPVDNGGKGRGFSPTDLVGTALSSCILTIMAKAAEKKGLDMTGSSIEITKEMIGPPRQIGSLIGYVEFPESFSPDDKNSLLRYIRSCPVHQTLLGEEVEISIKEK